MVLETLKHQEVRHYKARHSKDKDMCDVWDYI